MTRSQRRRRAADMGRGRARPGGPSPRPASDAAHATQRTRAGAEPLAAASMCARKGRSTARRRGGPGAAGRLGVRCGAARTRRTETRQPARQSAPPMHGSQRPGLPGPRWSLDTPRQGRIMDVGLFCAFEDSDFLNP